MLVVMAARDVVATLAETVACPRICAFHLRPMLSLDVPRMIGLC